MPYSNIVFIKLFLSLFEEDDRFLYQLNESQQLLYIKLLYMAGSTENKITKNLKFISDKVNYHHEQDCLKADIKRIREVFPKFVEGEDCYYFENFSALHNWVTKDKSKIWKDKDGTPYGSSHGSSQGSGQKKNKKKNKNKKEEVDVATPTEGASLEGITSTEFHSGTSSTTFSLAVSEQMDILVKQWNDIVPWKVNGLTPKRKEHLVARLKEPGFFENFETITKKIMDSDFLSNRKDAPNDKNFKATFDWVIRDSENWVRIMEGKYTDNKKQEDGRV